MKDYPIKNMNSTSSPHQGCHWKPEHEEKDCPEMEFVTRGHTQSSSEYKPKPVTREMINKLFDLIKENARLLEIERQSSSEKIEEFAGASYVAPDHYDRPWAVAAAAHPNTEQEWTDFEATIFPWLKTELTPASLLKKISTIHQELLEKERCECEKLIETIHLYNSNAHEIMTEAEAYEKGKREERALLTKDWPVSVDAIIEKGKREERARIIQMVRGMKGTKDHICGSNDGTSNCECFNAALADILSKIKE